MRTAASSCASASSGRPCRTSTCARLLRASGSSGDAVDRGFVAAPGLGQVTLSIRRVSRSTLVQCFTRPALAGLDARAGLDRARIADGRRRRRIGRRIGSGRRHRQHARHANHQQRAGKGGEREERPIRGTTRLAGRNGSRFRDRGGELSATRAASPGVQERFTAPTARDRDAPASLDLPPGKDPHAGLPDRRC